MFLAEMVVYIIVLEGGNQDVLFLSYYVVNHKQWHLPV